MSTEASSISIAGEGWVDVRTIRLVEHEEPLEVTWTASQTWEVTVPLVAGPNVINLQAVDFQGNDLGSLFSPGSDSITITSTAENRTPYEYLRITELHYHPDEDDDLEFIELHNLSNRSLDLGGTKFSDGVEFTFDDGISMPGGAYALLVRDRVAFEAQHGTDLTIIGEYGPATSLSNRGGEG